MTPPPQFSARLSSILLEQGQIQTWNENSILYCTPGKSHRHRAAAAFFFSFFTLSCTHELRNTPTTVGCKSKPRWATVTGKHTQTHKVDKDVLTSWIKWVYVRQHFPCAISWPPVCQLAWIGKYCASLFFTISHSTLSSHSSSSQSTPAQTRSDSIWEKLWPTLVIWPNISNKMVESCVGCLFFKLSVQSSVPHSPSISCEP